MSQPYNTTTVERDGRAFRVDWRYDETRGPPEHESDGHGVIADVASNPETYGEGHDPETDDELDMEEVVRHKMMRVLRRGSTWRGEDWRVYDVWETMKQAKAEGWRSLKWEAEHPNATEEEKLMAAVDADFEFLAGWYNDDWHWCGITVRLLDEDGDPTTYDASLWGLSSDDDEYHDEVIAELVREVQAQALAA